MSLTKANIVTLSICKYIGNNAISRLDIYLVVVVLKKAITRKIQKHNYLTSDI
jgi:hypothetical protein